MEKTNGFKILISATAIAAITLFSVTGCTTASKQSAPIDTSSEVAPNTYKVLNPHGMPLPIDIKALAPRLNTVNDKTIYIELNEPEPVIAPALLEKLRTSYPKTNWRFKIDTGFGPDTPEEEVLNLANGLIRGNSW